MLEQHEVPGGADREKLGDTFDDTEHDGPQEIEQSGSAVKLSITHTIEREGSKFMEAVAGGWPKVVSNLKSMLETGSAALVDPYPAPNVAARTA